MIALSTLVLAVAYLGNVNFPVDDIQRFMDMREGSEQRENRLREEGERRQLTKTEPSPPASANALREYKYSVVRITAELKGKNPFQPWVDMGTAMFSGSGFAVKETANGPLIATNCHVVLDATVVKISVPAYSAEEYKCRVVMLNPEMDIAFIELMPDEHKRLKADLADKKGLVPVKFYEGLATLGQDVIALGFPLGQKNPKLTSGVISGNEKVGTFISFQQTAQISPGNSGGPLFAAGTNQVIGINFATAAGNSSQNNNFAIPSWQVIQMIQEFEKSESGTTETTVEEEKSAADEEDPKEEGEADGEDDGMGFVIPGKAASSMMHKHHEDKTNAVKRVKPFNSKMCRESHDQCIYTIPKVTAEVASVVTPELTLSDNCKSGVLISKWSNSSIFAFAEPKFPERVFLEEVRGQKLDEFGMVIAKEYFDDPVRFDDLLFLTPTLDDAEVTVCSCGKKSTHKLPTSAFEALIPESPFDGPAEPNVYMSKTPDFYENFAGITVMPLTATIAKAIYNKGRMDIVPVLMKAAQGGSSPELLAITGVSQFGTELPQGLSAGDLVAKVNGKNVTTLAEFRAAFEPDSHSTCDVAEPMEGVPTPAETDNLSEFVDDFMGLAHTRARRDSNDDSLRRREWAAESSFAQIDDTRVWSIETQAGKEYVVYYHDALKTQSTYAANGEVPMTMAVKTALGKENIHGSAQELGLSFSEGVMRDQPDAKVLPIEERKDVLRRTDDLWEFMMPDGMRGISI